MGFLYGAPRYLRARKPLYATMIVFGVGCTALGRLYQCVRILTGYPLMGRFQVGVLGILGTFAFFFSANYGQIDSLVDDGGSAFRRYRVIAWAGPALIAVLYLPVVLGSQSIVEKVVSAVVAFVIGAACYYHIKHILIPDVDYGVVKCLRKFNALALLYGILCMLEMIALAYEATVLLIAAGGLLTLVSIAFATGLGFALLENLLILIQNIDSVTVTWAFARGIGAALMHSVCTSLIGMGISYVRKRRKLFYCGTFSLLIAAIIYHAVFNSLVQSQYRIFGFILPTLVCFPLFDHFHKGANQNSKDG